MAVLVARVDVSAQRPRSRNAEAEVRRAVEAVLRRTATELGLRSAAIRGDTELAHVVELSAASVSREQAVRAASRIRADLEGLDGELKERNAGPVTCRIAVAPDDAQAQELLKKAGPNEILTTSIEGFGPDIVSDDGDDGIYRIHGVKADDESPRRDGGPAEPTHYTLGTLLTVVGSVAALTAWLALIGGLMMWARFHAAGIPEAEGVAVLPRAELVTQGLRALVLPVVVATLAAAIGYLVASPRIRASVGGRDTDGPSAAGADRDVSGLLGAVVVVALAFLAFVVWLAIHVHPWYVVGIATLALLGLSALLVVALVAGKTARPGMLTAIAIFVLAALLSGALVTLREAGSKQPRLDVARVVRKDAPPVDGLFMARAAGAVYVGGKTARRSCGIVIVPESDVRAVLIGASATAAQASDGLAAVGKEECLRSQQRPPPRALTRTITREVPVPVAASTTTVTAAASTATTTIAGSTTTIPGSITTVAGSTSTLTETIRSGSDLVIKHYAFRPVDNRHVAARFWVADENGEPVRGVLLYVLPLRYARVPLMWTETGAGGFASVLLDVQRFRAVGRGRRVVIFVRARRASSSTAGGTKALFQVRLPKLR